MFGRPFRIPTDLLYVHMDPRQFYSLKQFQDNMKFMYECAQDAMMKSQTKMKTYYDRKRKDDDLHVGDYVYVYIPRIRSTQLKAKWHGPHLITQKSVTNYEVEMIIDGVTRLKWLPRDRLKRCYQDGRNTAVQHDDNPEMQIPDLDIESSSSSDDDISTDDNSNNEKPGYNLTYFTLLYFGQAPARTI